MNQRRLINNLKLIGTLVLLFIWILLIRNQVDTMGAMLIVSIGILIVCIVVWRIGITIFIENRYKADMTPRDSKKAGEGEGRMQEQTGSPDPARRAAKSENMGTNPAGTNPPAGTANAADTQPTQTMDPKERKRRLQEETVWMCPKCGETNLMVEKVCPKCGAEHDRDINAAINIREEGKRISTVGTTGSYAYGEGVRRLQPKHRTVAQSSLK